MFLYGDTMFSTPVFMAVVSTMWNCCIIWEFQGKAQFSAQHSQFLEAIKPGDITDLLNSIFYNKSVTKLNNI